MKMRVSRLAAPGLFVACTILLSGCKPTNPTEAKVVPPSVDVAPVAYENVALKNAFTGSVAAVNTVDIRPRVTGHLSRIAYQEGGRVVKGDLLFVIDQRPYQIALDSARAQLDRARVTQKLARLQDLRAKSLLSEKATSREEGEERASAFAQASADVKAAEAAVRSAELNLEFTEVRAPVSGVTSRAAITIGNMAVADQTILTTLVSRDPMYVYFDVDEKTFIHMKDALEAPSRAAGKIEIRVGRATDEAYPFAAKIDLVDNRIETTTGTIRMRALVENGSGAFVPGMFAKVQIAIATQSPVVLVADRAIQTDLDRKYVYVVGADNKAVRRYVDISSTFDGLSVVQRGLTKTDAVVVGGVQKIFASDTEVQPRRVAPSASPAAGSSVSGPVQNQ